MRVTKISVKMKAFWLLWLWLIMILAVKQDVKAKTETTGSFGDEITWELATNGTLTISGMGEIPDNLYSPWISVNRRIGIRKIVINEGITRIGNYAFYDLTYVTSVKLPSTLREIGWGAFEDLHYLSEIDIPAGVKVIEGIAFDGTSWLDKKRKENPLVIINGILIDGMDFEGDILVIPSNVKSIASQAFWGNNSFKTLILPEGLTELQSQTFSLYYQWDKVYIPASVKVIGNEAFEYINTSLKNIYYGGSEKDWQNVSKESQDWGIMFAEIHYQATPSEMLFDDAHVVLPTSLGRIEEEAFCNDTFASVYLQDGIKTIGTRAFAGCTGLKCIRIPKSVSFISEDAFEGIDNLVISGPKGSYAQTYGSLYGYTFLGE